MILFLGYALKKWSPTSLAPGTGFMKDNFSMDQGWGGVGETGGGAQVMMQAVFSDQKEGGWGCLI